MNKSNTFSNQEIKKLRCLSQKYYHSSRNMGLVFLSSVKQMRIFSYLRNGKCSWDTHTVSRSSHGGRCLFSYQKSIPNTRTYYHTASIYAHNYEYLGFSRRINSMRIVKFTFMLDRSVSIVVSARKKSFFERSRPKIRFELLKKSDR